MSEQPEELIRAALKDGCRAHCDSLIDELRRQHEEIVALRAAVVAAGDRLLYSKWRADMNPNDLVRFAQSAGPAGESK